MLKPRNKPYINVVNNSKQALEKLFDITTDIIDGPSKHNTNPYEYYQKSSRDDVNEIRKVLESWFKEYPVKETKELKGRFKKEFYTAFYELFLFKLFKNQGFKIEIHPKLKLSKKRPDFLIEKNGHKCYVEAKVFTDKTKEQVGVEKKQNQLLDEINKIRIKGFLLQISELSFLTNKQPRTKELIKLIESEVSKINRKELEKDLAEKGFDRIPEIKYKNKDFSISVRPMPLIDSVKDKISDTPIGMLPVETFWGGGQESLKGSIIKKAKRYGEFEIPYLICINAIGHKTSGKIEIENVIWGSLAWSFTNNPDDKDGKWIRKSDGIFHNGRRATKTNVSGILVTKVFPFGIPNSKYWLYKHPFAKYPFDFELLDLKLNFIKDGQIISQEGEDLDKIFEISKSWLSE